MKTQSKELIKLVNQLAVVIETRKEIENREKKLKGAIRVAMGDNLLLEAGEHCVLVELRNRSSLDKDALMHDMGNDFIQKYSKWSAYETMSVRPVINSTVKLTV